MRVLLFQDFGQLVDPNALNAPPLAGLGTAPEPSLEQAAAIADVAARRQAAARAQAERTRQAQASQAATAGPSVQRGPAPRAAPDQSTPETPPGGPSPAPGGAA